MKSILTSFIFKLQYKWKHIFDLC